MASKRPGTLRRRQSTGSFTFRLRRRDRRIALAFGLAGLLLVVVALWSVWPYWQLAGRFETLPSVEPSRLYGRPLRLLAGLAFDPDRLIERLADLSYHPASERGLLPGTYHATASRVTIARRTFRAQLGDGGGGLLVCDFGGDDGGRITALELDGKRVAEAYLDPPLLATYYGPDLREVRPTPLDRIPSDVVRAVLAAEDASFFEHPGVSPTGIARALWANLSGGEVRQGGSTVTQQLAKNLYLTSERTVSRKLREATLAVFLEWRYTKEQILEAYLNQIFWGRSGGASLIGVGAASWHYFGKRPEELELADGALLAAMIKAPADYSPVRRAAAAKARRDFVLDRLVALRWTSPAVAAAAKERALPEREAALSRRRAPYFADAVAAEVAQRWAIPTLADTGWTVLSTLDTLDQERAERAITEGMSGLEEKSKKARAKSGQFQAALVSLEPATGAVRAYVGGRSYRESQFDRVAQARRQAGSAFKPIVYAAAFETGAATPGTLVEDAPLSVLSGGKLWTPQNDDDEFRGWVTARTALEQSLNVPTARLALQTGLPAIVETAKRAGISTRLRPVPSIALGAFEVVPLELATAYAVLANRGVRPPVHRVESVLDREGRALAGRPLPPPERVLSTQTAYLVTTLLQGVIDYGTGRAARGLGLGDPVAGKTGTTNLRRDNWFAGYTPDRVSLVWVGFDDDSPTPFSGSRAALPIWTEFTKSVRPPNGFAAFTPPAGIRVVLIDPETGELATDRCPQVLSEAFPEDRVPREVCRTHGGYFARPLDPEIRAEQEEERDEGGIRGWLRRVFGRDRRQPGPPSAPPP
jgi:penicillin-binding protein 1B